MTEEYGDGEEGYIAGPNTQHCAGVIGMYLNGGETEWPGIDNEEPPGDYWPAQKVAFDSADAFLDANTETARARKAHA